MHAKFSPRAAQLMDRESDLNVDHDGDGFTLPRSRCEPPSRGRTQRLLVEAEPGVERAYNAKARTHAAGLHDALDDHCALDSCAHRLDRVMGLFLMHGNGHRDAVARSVDVASNVPSTTGAKTVVVS